MPLTSFSSFPSVSPLLFIHETYFLLFFGVTKLLTASTRCVSVGFLPKSQAQREDLFGLIDHFAWDNPGFHLLSVCNYRGSFKGLEIKDMLILLSVTIKYRRPLWEQFS